MLREALTGRGRWILSSNMNADLIVGTSLPVVRKLFDGGLALKCLKNKNGPFFL